MAGIRLRGDELRRGSDGYVVIALSYPIPTVGCFTFLGHRPLSRGPGRGWRCFYRRDGDGVWAAVNVTGTHACWIQEVIGFGFMVSGVLVFLAFQSGFESFSTLGS